MDLRKASVKLGTLWTLTTGSLSVNGIIVEPVIPEGGVSENAAWTRSFVDPYTEFEIPEAGGTSDVPPSDEGNPVNLFPVEGTVQLDARLYQIGAPGAIITSSGGIYDFNSPLTFLTYGAPEFDVSSVLFQTSSVGSVPDIESASLLYRESADGLLIEAPAPTGTGFLQLGAGLFAQTFTAWEWDLSGTSIYDFFVIFESASSSLSLWDLSLDTLGTPTSYLDGVRFDITANSGFSGFYQVLHNKAGESEPRIVYQVGDTVEVTAVEGFEFKFVGWTGDLSGDNEFETVILDEDPTVRGVFSPETYFAWMTDTITPAFMIPNPPYSQRSPANANPDGDPFPNIMEYAFGGFPEVYDADRITPKLVVNSEGEVFYVFRRQMGATDLVYRVQVSTDLVTWNYNGDGTGIDYTEEQPNPVFNGDGTETVTAKILSPDPDTDSVFVRIEIIWTQ
ncbi:MAG: hypothetical protein AAGJ81_02870 [Verrucomicrobiota bacterium]